MKQVSRFQLASIVLAIITFLASRILAHFPNFVEKYYSRTIYQKIASALSAFSDLFPFSLTEIGILIILSVMVFYSYRAGMSMIKKQISLPVLAKKVSLSILTFIAIIYIVFEIS